MKALRDYVVVKKEEDVKQTAGGLYVPGNVEEKVSTGKVMAVGSGHLCSTGTVVPLEVKVGDVVSFHKGTATELRFNGESAFLMRENQIYCVV